MQFHIHQHFRMNDQVCHQANKCMHASAHVHTCKHVYIITYQETYIYVSHEHMNYNEISLCAKRNRKYQEVTGSERREEKEREIVLEGEVSKRERERQRKKERKRITSTSTHTCKDTYACTHAQTCRNVYKQAHARIKSPSHTIHTQAHTNRHTNKKSIDT